MRFFSCFLLITFLLAFSCTVPPAEEAVVDDTAQEEPELDMQKIAENIMKTLNSGDPVALANLYAVDAVCIQSGEPEPIRGREALLQYYKGILAAVPDLKFEVTSILFSGETIIVEFLFSGTFTGPLATPQGELAPTGKSFKTRSVTFFKIAPDGLVAEDRTYFDNLDHMKQLGLIN
jgi:steroid delta-isomerase-like uncharacterized protein